jgi:hypothetical protein
MKYLKTYTKLFESVITESEFPTELNIQELFYDLTDDEPLSKCKLYESGYQYFSTDNLTRSTIRSQLFSDMSFEENWINKECEDTQDTWKNMFIDLSKPISNDMIFLASKNYNDVYFSEVESSKNRHGKSFLERLQENILNDIIPGCPIIYLDLGQFNPDKLPVVIDCLRRLYEVTGFRPTSSIWGLNCHGFNAVNTISGGTINQIVSVRADLQLYKVNDIEYKNLCKIFSTGNYTPEMVNQFL